MTRAVIYPAFLPDFRCSGWDEVGKLRGLNPGILPVLIFWTLKTPVFAGVSAGFEKIYVTIGFFLKNELAGIHTT